MELSIDTAALKRVAIEAGKAGLPFIEQGISAALAGAAGPFGFLVGPALNVIFPQINAALGLDPATPPDETAAKIAEDPAAAATALAPIDAELAKQKQADDTRLASQAQQTALIALDTSAQGWLQRNWRPMLAFALGVIVVAFKGLPLVVWFVLCFGHKLPDVPPIDTDTFLAVCGLLGITVAARSVDKTVKAQTVKAVTTAAVRR